MRNLVLSPFSSALLKGDKPFTVLCCMCADAVMSVVASTRQRTWIGLVPLLNCQRSLHTAPSDALCVLAEVS